jgi:Phosphoenolpyruvate carboxylase
MRRLRHWKPCAEKYLPFGDRSVLRVLLVVYRYLCIYVCILDLLMCRQQDEIRRLKPTPQMEANGGIAIIETVLWDAVPSYLRKLNAQVEESLGLQLPLDCVPIRFSSWMGGDRDGNPNVTPMVTLEVAARQRLRAAKLILVSPCVLGCSPRITTISC